MRTLSILNLFFLFIIASCSIEQDDMNNKSRRLDAQKAKKDKEGFGLVPEDINNTGDFWDSAKTNGEVTPLSYNQLFEN